MTASPQLLREIQLVVAALAVLGGLQLLFRGLRSYLRGGDLSSVGTSRIASLNAGLVRVTGTIEAPITIQSYHGFPCVYYRAERRKEDRQADDDSSAIVERSIEFDVRDDSGRIHVMPHAAQWDVRRRCAARGAPRGRRPGDRRWQCRALRTAPGSGVLRLAGAR